MKRFLAIILSVALLCTFVPAASAATSEESGAAQALYDLGLFQGTGNNDDGTPNFDLDRTPTRAEAVTMLVRLLGKDAEAKAGTWETPFTDVADWAKPYVGYAYTNGLTTGTSDTTFGGDATVNATQYLTFVLRALGYTSGADFQWDSAWTKSDEIGMTAGQYNASTTSFTRGDVALISNSALSAEVNGQNQSLSKTLGITKNEVTVEDLQGVWKRKEKDESVTAYFFFDGNSYTNTEVRIHSTGQGYSSITFNEGTYKIDDGIISLQGVWKHTDIAAGYEEKPQSININISKFFALDGSGYYEKLSDPALVATAKEQMADVERRVKEYPSQNLTYDEKKEVVETLDRLTDVAQTTLSSLKLALTAAQALTLGNIAGMTSIKRSEMETSMETGVKGTKLGCELIGDAMIRLKEILENKSGADSLVAKIDNLIDLCDSVQTTNFSVTNYETFVDRTIDVTDSMGEIMNLFTNEYLN